MPLTVSYVSYDLFSVCFPQKQEMHRKDAIGQCKELCTSYSVLAIGGMLSEGSSIEENRYACMCMHVQYV